MTGNNKRHVIVGDGVTALEFAEATRLDKGDQLTIIGPEVKQLGRGVAYAQEPESAPWRYAYLLNSPSFGVSSEFADWMHDHWEHLKTIMSGRRPDWVKDGTPYIARGDISGLNAPRSLFGDFLHRRAERLLASLRDRGIDVVEIEDAVVDIHEVENKLTVITRNGRQLYVDSVDVATGGPVGQRYEGDDTAGSFQSLFGNEAQIVERLNPGSRVCCIGSNATMLDVLRLCQSVLDEEQFELIALSPAARLPEALYPPWPRTLTEPDLGGPCTTAAEFIDVISREMRLARHKGERMAEMRGGFRKVFVDRGLSAFVPDMAEARKVPGFIRKTFLGGTRDSIEDFQRLQVLGTTRLQAMTVSEIRAGSNELQIHGIDTEGRANVHRADIVLNCAGPGRIPTFDGLTQSMIVKGWLSVCGVSGGLQVGADCQTAVQGVRHLSPATTVIGNEVMAYPLYDAEQLRVVVRKANGLTPD